MKKNNRYLLCALPELPPFDGPPPLERRRFAELVAQCDGPSLLVETLLLFDDLVEREAVLCGELLPRNVAPAVISREQAAGEEPLPDYLTASAQGSEPAVRSPILADLTWHRYFLHADKVSRRLPDSLLGRWIAFETGLRNALAVVRAGILELEPQIYLVAPEIADPVEDFDTLVREWNMAGNPLEAHELLEKHRWNWIGAHDEWYSFRDTEVGAYALRLMLLHRRHRVVRDKIREEGRKSP